MSYKFIIFIVSSIILMAGCQIEEAGTTEDELYERILELEQVVEQQSNMIEELRKPENDRRINTDIDSIVDEFSKDELIKTIERQKKSIEVLRQQLEFPSTFYPSTSMLDIIEQQQWLGELNNADWDTIRISRFDGDHEQVTIDDPILIKAADLFYLEVFDSASYPSGYQTDIVGYTYEFAKGNEIYKVRVVDRGVLKAGEPARYFRVDVNAHLIGNAFMPKPHYIQHNGLIAKMAASGAMKRGNQYAMYNAFRIQSAAYIPKEKLLTNKPSDLGEKIESLTFYYYGQELHMDAYQDYVHLHGAGEEEWYSLPYEVLSFTLNAG
ncbi:hypothetical protein [Desulfuribacillus alkaliarsenatis]|nr:hypothetical protein [Desulfuribacillus alkaliarsenatis]